MKLLECLEVECSAQEGPIVIESEQYDLRTVTDYFGISSIDSSLKCSDIKYFFGLLAMEKTSFNFDQTSKELTVNIHYNSRYSLLSKYKMKSEAGEMVSLVDFYFYRIQDSLDTLFFGKKPIKLKQVFE